MNLAILAVLSALAAQGPVLEAKTLSPAYRATVYASVPIDEGRFGVWLTLPEGVAEARLVGRLVDQAGVAQGERTADSVPSGFYQLSFAIMDSTAGRYEFQVDAYAGETRLATASCPLIVAEPSRFEAVLDWRGVLRVNGTEFLPIGCAAGPADPAGLPALGFGVLLPPADGGLTPEALAAAAGTVYALLPAPADLGPWAATNAVTAWALAAPDPARYQALLSADPYRPAVLAVEPNAPSAPIWADARASADVFLLGMTSATAADDAAALVALGEADGGFHPVWCLVPAGPAIPPEDVALRARAGLVVGARGVVFESPGESPEALAGRLGGLLKDLAGTTPLWLASASEDPIESADARVLVTARRIGSDRWIAALNTTTEDVDVRLTIAKGERVAEWPSGREHVLSADGSLDTSLSPRGLRVWMVR